MASKDLDGSPILILSLKHVKILKTLVDRTETIDQDIVMSRIFKFLQDPDCIKWEAEHGEES